MKHIPDEVEELLQIDHGAKSFLIVGASAMLLIAAFACTTEKTVYVLPDGTEVTPTTAQATQAVGGGSQTASSQPAPVGNASERATKPDESQPRQSAPAVNQRWNDKRNTLCSSLGLDAGLCEKIALDQTQPDGDEQDIDLPDEPDATPVPIDDVGAATGELNEIVAVEGEVSIQVLTYTESLIQQAADAVVQAEQELANQEATAAHLDAKKQELQELRQTYARLLEHIGVAQDKSLALAEKIEQEHLAFSIERANGEALIRYKDARLAHTNALAEAEKNAVAQIDAIASVNDAASEVVAERIDLAPLYKKRDEAQEVYDAAVRRFEEQVHRYEKNWLDVYDIYITESSVRDVENRRPYASYVGILGESDFGSGGADFRYGSYSYNGCVVLAYHRPFDQRPPSCGYGSYQVLGKDKLMAGATSGISEEKGDFNPEPVNLTLLQQDISNAEQAVVRAIAENEKVQSVAIIHSDAVNAIGIALSNAHLRIVEAYREYGISEGRAGSIFRFTDNGEDAVTYNLSLIALSREAETNLNSFKSALDSVLDDMNVDIREAESSRDKALSEVEDVRFEEADTVDSDRQERNDWRDTENIRRRILLMDSLMMSAGWGRIWGGFTTTWGTLNITSEYRGTNAVVPGRWCPSNAERPYYVTTTGIGRDSYIRNYWHKQQPLDRAYTLERLASVEDVVGNLEGWLEGQLDYWWEQDADTFAREHHYNLCESTLNWFRDKKQEILSKNPLQTD